MDLILLLVFLLIYLMLIGLSGMAAVVRNRNPVFWIAFAVFFSPFLALLFLAFLGKDEYANDSSQPEKQMS